MATILYAEDEFTNRRLLEMQLKSRGIRCDLAENGETAIRLAEDRKYDIVVLDIYMPGCGGEAAAKRIRKIQPDTPIFALTSDDEQVERLRKEGFAEVFIKPLRGDTHLDIIQEYLKNPSMTGIRENGVG